MASYIYISASKSYAKYDDTITLSLSGPLNSAYPYCAFLYRTPADATWSTRVGGGNEQKSITFKISDKTDVDSATEYVVFKACFLTAENGTVGAYTDNEVKVWLTHDLEKPEIISITPKSPRITEELRIEWKPVDNADYYAIEAYWYNSVSLKNESKVVRTNISATNFSGNPYATTIPSETLEGLQQIGAVYYKVHAYSNDPRYTTSSCAYSKVALSLASNVRYKLGGAWIRGKPYVKVGGQWRRAVKTYVKTNGIWRNA